MKEADMINEAEINSLIKLLDDPDQEIYDHVHEKLLTYGPTVITYLENAFGEAFDTIQQERIANLVHEIQFDMLKKDLELWHQSGAFDLLRGVLIINKFQYPDLDEQKVINQIEAIKRDIWMQMMFEGSPSDRLSSLTMFYTIFTVLAAIPPTIRTHKTAT